MWMTLLIIASLAGSNAGLAAEADAAQAGTNTDGNCIIVDMTCAAMDLPASSKSAPTGSRLTDARLSAQDLDELIHPKDATGIDIAKKPANTSTDDSLSTARDRLLGQKIAKAARVDCRTKYVSPEPNLLLIIPLLIETVTDTGCRW